MQQLLLHLLLCQNTKGVQAVHGVNPLIVADQIKAVMDDIKADAVKDWDGK